MELGDFNMGLRRLVSRSMYALAREDFITKYIKTEPAIVSHYLQYASEAKEIFH